MRHRVFFWQIIFLALALVGCHLGSRYEPPIIEIPCEWNSPKTAEMSESSPNGFLWWESLNDPLLTSLIKRAAVENIDLHIAAMRILQARLDKKGKAAELLPRVDGSATYGHVYYSKDALINGLLGTAIPKSELTNVKRNVDFFELGFDASWEIDLFGIKIHEIAALKAKIQASEENLCAIWTSLSAEIARNYIELRGLQKRLEILCRNIEAQNDTVNLYEKLLTSGLGNAIELNQAEEQLSILEAQQPQLEFFIEKAIHRLSILLGNPPADLYDALCEYTDIPQIPDEKPIGLPSELLRRRPDIKKAERELAAATELISSAVASLFPRLSLYGFIGDVSTHLKNIFSSAANTWFVAPQLLFPIFNSELIVQEINYNKIKAKEAFYNYQKTVLEAFEETENAIAAFYYEEQRNDYLANAQEASVETLELTQQLFQKGLKNYIEVLAMNRDALVAEDAYIQSQVALLSQYISLYKALGGAWELAECEIIKDCN